MNRKEFLKICSIMGINLPFSLSNARSNKAISSNEALNKPVDFTGKVIIVGAGAGGLSAGYLLHQQGIDFEILEASPTFGGRLKVDNDFASFPIPLGAEWLETDQSIFQKIINDDSINASIETIEDAFNRKFIHYSWYHFYEDYILPSVADKIRYDTIVESIDTTNDKIIISTQPINDKTSQYEADKVIVSVPLKMLQDNQINFIPDLPKKKRQSINNVTIHDGFKAFFEFSKHFYGNGYEFSIKPKYAGEKIYYNAAFGQKTNQNVLGLFVLGEPVSSFNGRSSESIKSLVLNELDALFNNQATPNYIKHTFQNWQNEPFINGGYLADNSDEKDVARIGQSIDNKIYFVGAEYTDGKDWVSVHLAAESAKRNINDLLS